MLIYLPEVAFDQEAFLAKVEESFEKNCNVIVCVSEGIHDAQGTFICEYDNSVGTDNFGHKMLAGCGKYLENLVRSRLCVKARSVELNGSQRCSASMLSATDQQEAISAGTFGVKAALNGETGKMVSFGFSPVAITSRIRVSVAAPKMPSTSVCSMYARWKSIVACWDCSPQMPSMAPA